MRKRKEKSAWVLDTPEADYEVAQSDIILPAAAEKVSIEVPTDYPTIRAMFAAKGHTLTRAHRVPCGRITYTVTRWNNSRTFADLSSLQARLAQVLEGAL